MAMQPEVLILDEPTSQLDPIAAADFLNTVRKINLELECAAGGGYEAWEPMWKFAFADMAKDYVRYIGHKGGYSIHKVKGHFELTLEGDTYGRKEN